MFVPSGALQGPVSNLFLIGGVSSGGPHRDKHQGHFSLGALLCLTDQTPSVTPFWAPSILKGFLLFQRTSFYFKGLPYISKDFLIFQRISFRFKGLPSSSKDLTRPYVRPPLPSPAAASSSGPRAPPEPAPPERGTSAEYPGLSPGGASAAASGRGQESYRYSKRFRKLQRFWTCNVKRSIASDQHVDIPKILEITRFENVYRRSKILDILNILKVSKLFGTGPPERGPRASLGHLLGGRVPPQSLGSPASRRGERLVSNCLRTVFRSLLD